MSTIVLPKALIARSIKPNLLALAVTEAALPLTGVFSACRIGEGRTRLALGVGIVSLVSHGLLVFDGGKIPAVSTLRLLKQ